MTDKTLALAEVDELLDSHYLAWKNTTVDGQPVDEFMHQFASAEIGRLFTQSLMDAIERKLFAFLDDVFSK